MANLTRAHDELFRRSPDERYPSLQELLAHTVAEKERSTDRWELPRDLKPLAHEGALKLAMGSDGASLVLNDWSFTQLATWPG